MACSGAIWNDVGHICHVDNCKWAYIGIVNPDHDSHSPSRWTATDLAKLNILSGAQSWFFDKPELDIQNLPISHSVLNISIDSGPVEGDFEASRFVRYLRHAMNAKEGESRVDDLMAEVLRIAGFYEHETLHVVRQKNELLIAGGVLFNAIPDLAVHGIEVSGASFPRLVVENKVRRLSKSRSTVEIPMADWFCRSLVQTPRLRYRSWSQKGSPLPSST